jgi:hypothetical protein
MVFVGNQLKSWDVLMKNRLATAVRYSHDFTSQVLKRLNTATRNIQKIGSKVVSNAATKITDIGSKN